MGVGCRKRMKKKRRPHHSPHLLRQMASKLLLAKSEPLKLQHHRAQTLQFRKGARLQRFIRTRMPRENGMSSYLELAGALACAVHELYMCTHVQVRL